MRRSASTRHAGADEIKEKEEAVNVQLDATNRVAYLFLTFREHEDEPELFGMYMRALLLTRHDCDARPLRDGGDLHYDATYVEGAQSWRCATCYREWSHVAGTFAEADTTWKGPWATAASTSRTN